MVNYRALLLGLVLLLPACASSKTMHEQVEETLEQKGGFNVSSVVNEYEETKECAAKDTKGKCTKYKKGSKLQGYTGRATLTRGDKTCTLYLDTDKDGNVWTLDAVGDGTVEELDEPIELTGSPNKDRVNTFLDEFNKNKPANERVC